MDRFLSFLDTMETNAPDAVYECVRQLYGSIFEQQMPAQMHNVGSSTRHGNFAQMLHLMPPTAVQQTTAEPVSYGMQTRTIPTSSDSDDSRGDYPNPAVKGKCTVVPEGSKSEMPGFVRNPPKLTPKNPVMATFSTEKLAQRTKDNRPTGVVQFDCPTSAMTPRAGYNLAQPGIMGGQGHTSADVGYAAGGSSSGGGE